MSCLPHHQTSAGSMCWPTSSDEIAMATVDMGRSAGVSDSSDFHPSGLVRLPRLLFSMDE